jgi:hypothetical protein
MGNVGRPEKKTSIPLGSSKIRLQWMVCLLLAKIIYCDPGCPTSSERGFLFVDLAVLTSNQFMRDIQAVGILLCTSY